MSTYISSSETRKEVWDAFLAKYPKRGVVMKRYEEATYGEASWEGFSRASLELFIIHLKDKVSQNSARTYASQMKAFLNTHKDSCPRLTGDWEKSLSVRKIPTTFITLNEDEIDKIANFAINGEGDEVENSIAASFAVCSYTGCRLSDLPVISRQDLSKDTLRYVSMKTHITTEVPIAPIVRELVPLVEEYSISAYNRNIREVCRKLNINSPSNVYKGGVHQEGAKWEFVSSHTARRSFATNLHRRGGSLHTISKLMGHTNYDQTKTYINFNINDMDDAVMSFFK